MRWERKNKTLIQRGSDAGQQPDAETAKKTVVAMQQFKIPLTPENYHVWFKYVEGNNAKLNEAVNGIKQSDKIFSSGFNEQLYEEFIENGDHFRSLRQAQNHKGKRLYYTF